jgi:nucleoside phosphorylase
LITFAVMEEARPFQRRLAASESLRVVVTGMGRPNAERVVRAELARQTPKWLVTAGFAGGLNPALKTGDVLLDADEGFPLTTKFLNAGASWHTFLSVDAVVVDRAAKSALWRETGRDAVEMESACIRALARERGIPSATLRVISDAADESLPLDFNALMTPSMKLSLGRLALSLARSPASIPRLIAFQRRVKFAADRLAVVLEAAVRCP